MADRTLYQTIDQWHEYFKSLQPSITLQRSGTELRIQQGQRIEILRRATATPNQGSVRLR